MGEQQVSAFVEFTRASGLDLAGTQLVVLSACDTGLGEVQNDEGVFGLRRAFVVAGAQTLVRSLWELEDDATWRLMVDYYGRHIAGDGRVEALRRAQLAMLKEPNLAHPFFWAALIASGQAGALLELLPDVCNSPESMPPAVFPSFQTTKARDCEPAPYGMIRGGYLAGARSHR